MIPDILGQRVSSCVMSCWFSCIFLDSCGLFQHCPFLLPHGEDVQKVLEQWKEYKMGVPTYGAIILDETLENVRIYLDFLHAVFLQECGLYLIYECPLFLCFVS